MLQSGAAYVICQANTQHWIGVSRSQLAVVGTSAHRHAFLAIELADKSWLLECFSCSGAFLSVQAIVHEDAVTSEVCLETSERKSAFRWQIRCLGGHDYTVSPLSAPLYVLDAKGPGTVSLQKNVDAHFGLWEFHRLPNKRQLESVDASRTSKRRCEAQQQSLQRGSVNGGMLLIKLPRGPQAVLAPCATDLPAKQEPADTVATQQPQGVLLQVQQRDCPDARYSSQRASCWLNCVASLAVLLLPLLVAVWPRLPQVAVAINWRWPSP